MARWLKLWRPRRAFGRSLLGLAVLLLAAGGGVVAESRRNLTATLTVIVELMNEGPDVLPGVFAVYGPEQELRMSGPLVAERPFTVTANPGDRLYFALPCAVSGNVLFRPRGEGIDLFTAKGRPATGNVTAQVGLFDQAGEPATLGPATPIAKLIRVTIH